MTGFDIAVLLAVGLAAVTGFARGFVQELLALSAWLFTLFAIHYLHTPLNDFLLPVIGNGSGSSVLAFAVLMLVPYGTVKALARWAGQSSRSSFLGPIDRVLGFGFGGVKGLIVVVLGFSVIVLGSDLAWGFGGRPTWITQARSYPFINASSEKLVQIIAERRKAAALDASRRRGRK